MLISTRERTRCVLAATAFLIFFTASALGADNSPDTTAKFLAGLLVPAAQGETATGENLWTTHALELDRAWKRTERQLGAIADWSPQSLGDAYHENGTMFYMFSGPDFLYAHAFFPNARTYIFCGNEPVGAIPDLSRIPAEELPLALANIRKSLGSVLNWSFFITKDMKSDLTRTQLSGTLPLLYVFLARAGCTIDTVAPVSVDPAGNVTETDKGDAPGIRITFTSASGLSQVLYYFCSDLSDEGIRAKPGFLRFCEQQGRGASLLKAASYLMHDSGFSRVREFLLGHSDIIVQDDSGIPLRFFEGQSWDIRFCGKYLGPIAVFKQYWQPELANEYVRNGSPPLPFGFGYQWQPNQSDLMIFRRGGPEYRMVHYSRAPRAQPQPQQPPPRQDQRRSQPQPPPRSRSATPLRM